MGLFNLRLIYCERTLPALQSLQLHSGTAILEGEKAFKGDIRVKEGV